MSFNRRRTNREYVYIVTLVYRFCTCDLDLEPMTLTYELDLNILKTFAGHSRRRLKGRR